MSVDPYDQPDDDPEEEAHHTCRKCGKTGLWWGFAPGQLAERVLWEKRPRGHNGPHKCEFTGHFEDET